MCEQKPPKECAHSEFWPLYTGLRCCSDCGSLFKGTTVMRTPNGLKEPCRSGNHALSEVYREEIETGVDRVVKWCEDCGVMWADLMSGNLFKGRDIQKHVPRYITDETAKGTSP